MAKKTYTIKINSKYAKKLLRELELWGVKTSQYQVILITQNTNVADVVTETFRDSPTGLPYEIDVA